MIQKHQFNDCIFIVQRIVCKFLHVFHNLLSAIVVITNDTYISYEGVIYNFVIQGFVCNSFYVLLMMNYHMTVLLK